MSVRVKICGLKREADVHIACEAGADFCGFVVEVPNSPRSLAREQVRPLLAMVEALPVVVTRQKSADDLLVLVRFLAPYAIQLHGDEPPELVAMVKRQTSCAVWKALPLPPTSHPDASLKPLLEKARNFVKAGCDALVLDTATPAGFGGTGIVPSWELAAELVHRIEVPCFLAGGLTPENVAEAVAFVKPYGVDVSSGVEKEPGVKDPEKIRQFCQRAKRR